MSGDGDARFDNMLRRYIWLLSELHGGNQFSQEQLWRWLIEANAALAKAKEAHSDAAKVSRARISTT